MRFLAPSLIARVGARVGHALLALLALVAMPRRALADESTAGAAFRQADELAKQGKWAEACPLYEASYRSDPQVGVLLHVADCHERIGRTATAWAEFNDAVEISRRRQDQREAYAQSRADALAAKLAKIHLAPPKAVPPGFAVRRDGIDITPLVGTDLPVDPGEHELTASAPGYVEWTKKVTVGAAAGTTRVAIAELERVKVVEPTGPTPTGPTAPAAPRDGNVEITTQPDGRIAIDEKVVGTGRFQGPIASGRHVVDVTAPGTRPYHTEIYVEGGEHRSFEVTLEREQEVAVNAAGPAEFSSWEFGASLAPGVKGHADDPALVAIRVEIGKRWRHVNFGFYLEGATLSANGSCGTSLPGPTPSGPYDFGTRNQFSGCFYVTTGLQLYVHLMPARTWDPWLGLTPGFRFGQASYTQYNAAGQMGQSQSLFLPGIPVDVRAGVDYHPRVGALRGWAFGTFVDAQIMTIAQETDNSNHNNSDRNAAYMSWLAGLRTTVVF
jgi:hypothetical protein